MKTITFLLLIFFGFPTWAADITCYVVYLFQDSDPNAANVKHWEKLKTEEDLSWEDKNVSVHILLNTKGVFISFLEKKSKREGVYKGAFASFGQASFLLDVMPFKFEKKLVTSVEVACDNRSTGENP